MQQIAKKTEASALPDDLNSSGLLLNTATNPPTASSASNGDFESIRLCWKKGTNPFYCVDSETGAVSPPDCLLVPLGNSGIRQVRPGDHLLAEATAKFITDEEISPLADRLRPWVAARYDAFTIFDAAAHLDQQASTVSRAIQIRIGYALKELGCSRFEKKTATSRYWYSPPERNMATASPEIPEGK